MKSKGLIAFSTHLGELIYFDVNSLSISKHVISNLSQVFQLEMMGNFLIVVSDSERVRVLDPESQNCTQVLTGHQGYIINVTSDTVLCLDFNGRLLVTGSKDDTIRCWELDEKSIFRCTCVGVGHIAPFIVSGSEDNTVKFWKIPTNIRKPEEILNLMTTWSEHAHDKTIHCIKISPNNKFIVSTSSDKLAKVNNLTPLKLWSKKGNLLASLTGHKRSVNCASFSPVDKLLATGSSDFTIRLWSLTDFSCIKTLEESDSSIGSLFFLKNGFQLVSGYSCGAIKVWSIPENAILLTLEGHDDKVYIFDP
ncbi:hypothetical protein MXB_2265 [Myxobolus squamalis]|nr:hypothetical protein MXB_2265 [Myxobolus squamalis]